MRTMKYLSVFEEIVQRVDRLESWLGDMYRLILDLRERLERLESQMNGGRGHENKQ